MTSEQIPHSPEALRSVAPRYNCELDFCTHPCLQPAQSILLTFHMATVNSSNHCISSPKT